jgi:putative ATP-dependent endonuclease of OLD family
MLFANKIIFVEGLAEQLLLPCFAAYKNIDDNITQEDELINQHISIVSVDSRTFNHFLRLYSYNEKNPYAIKKKVVCITDADPSIGKNACFPFELNGDENHNPIASHVVNLKTDFEANYDNIFVYHPESSKGKTLEYELARYNSNSKLLFTDSFPDEKSPHTIENFNLLQKELVKNPNDYSKVAEKYESFQYLNQKQKDTIKYLIEKIENSKFSANEKPIALFSALFYNVVKKLKGENALLLENNLRKDLEKDRPEFKIPDYLEIALNKILE